MVRKHQIFSLLPGLKFKLTIKSTSQPLACQDRHQQAFVHLLLPVYWVHATHRVPKVPFNPSPRLLPVPCLPWPKHSIHWGFTASPSSPRAFQRSLSVSLCSAPLRGRLEGDELPREGQVTRPKSRAHCSGKQRGPRPERLFLLCFASEGSVAPIRLGEDPYPSILSRTLCCTRTCADGGCAASSSDQGTISTQQKWHLLHLKLHCL